MRIAALALLGVLLVLSFPVEAITHHENKIIRLHVLAHNDSSPEQELKLQVRDVVIKRVSELLDGVDSFTRAVEIIGTHLPELKAIAETRLGELGSAHEVSLQWGSFLFPTRVYGQVALPAGVYPALNVSIGLARGNNWWCVMYPPLCHVEGVIGKGQGTRFELAIVNLLRGLWQRLWS